MPNLLNVLGRLLCWLGLHDYRVVDRTFEFGLGGDTEKLQCRRCGRTIIRNT